MVTLGKKIGNEILVYRKVSTLINVWEFDVEFSEAEEMVTSILCQSLKRNATKKIVKSAIGFADSRDLLHEFWLTVDTELFYSKG